MPGNATGANAESRHSRSHLRNLLALMPALRTTTSIFPIEAVSFPIGANSRRPQAENVNLVMDHVCVRMFFADASLPTLNVQSQTSSIERFQSNSRSTVQGMPIRLPWSQSALDEVASRRSVSVSTPSTVAVAFIACTIFTMLLRLVADRLESLARWRNCLSILTWRKSYRSRT